MDFTLTKISDLNPDQREAVECLLGHSLAGIEKVAIRVLADGNGILVRFFGDDQNGTRDSGVGKWNVPSCFNLLTDLSDEESAEYDVAVAEPVKLSRPGCA